MQIENRVEKFVRDAIINDPVLKKTYTSKKVFMAYAAPNSLSSFNEYILIQRISTVTLDTGYTDGTKGDTLRRVRLQIDVNDVDYENCIRRSEQVKSVLKTKFPSCLEDETMGYTELGQKVWVVSSIDIFLTESEDYYGDESY